ncbi:MAG: methionine--tRNA ligase, partial [Nitrospiria bacterium]
LKLSVDIGGERRQIVAGMAKRYSPEDLVHKKVIVVANLKPVRIMGVESQGMILAAGDKEVAALATFLEDVEPGTPIK